ncbi:MAG TPA: phosphoribosylanthranilate isomerase, partial [Chitinophagaceae bacterium]
MKVKVCGITRFDQLEQLDLLNADFAGMIFYKNSKRSVGDSLERYKGHIKDLNIIKVGVFVNAGIDEILKAINDFGLDVIQLHGDESALFCKELASQIKLIKAFRVNPETDIESMIDNYRSVCDYFLFDTLPVDGNAAEYGGTGKRFDWSILM